MARWPKVITTWGARWNGSGTAHEILDPGAVVETPADKPREGEASVYITRDELQFLRGLGRHQIHIRRGDDRPRGVVPLSRLLRRYLDAADRRAIWDGIDKGECVKLAKALLADAVIAERRGQ